MSEYVLTHGGFYVVPDDELYHYGVKGMKWGQRKASYAAEKEAYRSAKKDYKKASKEYYRSGGFGIKGISKATKAQNKMNSAELKAIDAKAKYKSAKSKDAEKAEFNTYRKEMQKTGLVGSAADTQSGGRSTRLYDHIRNTKGKKYADSVQKKVENVAVKRLIGTAAVTAGAIAVNTYLATR